MDGVADGAAPSSTSRPRHYSRPADPRRAILAAEAFMESDAPESVEEARARCGVAVVPRPAGSDALRQALSDKKPPCLLRRSRVLGPGSAMQRANGALCRDGAARASRRGSPRPGVLFCAWGGRSTTTPGRGVSDEGGGSGSGCRSSDLTSDRRRHDSAWCAAASKAGRNRAAHRRLRMTAGLGSTAVDAVLSERRGSAVGMAPSALWAGRPDAAGPMISIERPRQRYGASLRDG